MPILCDHGPGRKDFQRFPHSLLRSPPTEIYKGLSLTVVGNTAFHLMGSGDIYTWDSDRNQYAFYTHVPALPLINVEIPFSGQSEGVRAQRTKAVSCLIPSEDGLYGFNDLSGLIGPIDQEGWHAHDVRLDTSALKTARDAYPEAFQNAFITEGKAYLTAGNSALVLYNGETSTTTSYSANYARITSCTITVMEIAIEI